MTGSVQIFGNSTSKPMPTTRILLIASLILGSSLQAQTTTIAPRGSSFATAPAETLTLTPWSMFGTIGGKNLELMLGRVNLYAYNVTAGMDKYSNSNVGILSRPEGVPNGSYIARLSLGWTNMATTLSIKSNNTVIGQCTIAPQMTWEADQTCETPAVDVTDGKLAISFEIASGSVVYFRNATLSYYPPTTLKLR